MRYLADCLGKPVAVTFFAFTVSTAVTAQEANDSTTLTRVTVRGSEVREFDWAKSHARAQVVYVSSGPKTLGGRLIDNDLQTAYRFSESDPAPTAVVELGSSAKLHRVSAIFKAEDARVDVLLLNELPKDPADLRFAKPDASVVTLPDERGSITVDFSVSSARYVALRWKRNNRHEPFTVAEISAFSNDPTNLITTEDAALAENAKSLAIAEPPPVGIVSP
jgi:hypothetical protein